MDGVLLLAFLLGLPANELVLPIAVMIYRAEGVLFSTPSIPEMKALFLANGWTHTTALCVLLFFLFHWPCATTLLTIKKETGSLRYTLLAALLPTALGVLLCAAVTAVARLLG
jgi:ferrous iron transport protein B